MHYTQTQAAQISIITPIETSFTPQLDFAKYASCHQFVLITIWITSWRPLKTSTPPFPSEDKLMGGSEAELQNVTTRLETKQQVHTE